MIHRSYYSTALAQSQGIVPECLTLFELWEPGMSAAQLFEATWTANALNLDSERRLRNVVLEGFGSRFLRETFIESVPYIKELVLKSSDMTFVNQLILLYALRQHGIFFDFLTEEYWPAIRNGGVTLDTSDPQLLIDRALVTGKLQKSWSDATRERVGGYVLGIAADFDLLGPNKKGRRDILPWTLNETMVLYLAYDLHFLGASDDEVVTSADWAPLGLLREDVSLYLNRLQTRDHLITQDTGHLCRIDWKYTSREELNHVILS
jgi:hypothetical protein